MHHCAIDDALHDRGFKKTHPRHRIIELFHTPRLWSVRAIRKHLHDVAQATIYRTLAMLQKEGIIVPVRTGGEETAFERAGQEHHDHRMCRDCHIVACIPCPVPSLANHSLEIQGACASCAR